MKVATLTHFLKATSIKAPIKTIKKKKSKPNPRFNWKDSNAEIRGYSRSNGTHNLLVTKISKIKLNAIICESKSFFCCPLTTIPRNIEI